MALVVVTGGSRSGKSSAAQDLAVRMSERLPVTVAVFGKSGDDEMARRVACHRSSRPAHFDTVEVETSEQLQTVLGREGLVVIDCLGTALGAMMEECWPGGDTQPLGDAGADKLPEGYASRVEAVFSAVIDSVVRRAGDTLVVTNEVGSGLVSTWASGRLFADLLGAANAALVNAADAAYLVVCGRVADLKAMDSRLSWPED